MFTSARNKVNTRIQKLDLQDAFMKILPSMAEDFVAYNKQQLYDFGVDAAGNPTGQYAPSTVAYKISVGDRYDHITLHDTGDFYDSMKLEVEGDGATIQGDMVKDGTDLAVIYPQALGLTVDSKEEMNPKVAKLMLTELKSRL